MKWPPLVVAGLAGGIASGKSTVGLIFAELGAAVIDADRVGHEVVEPGEPALAEIVAAFGAGYLLPDGRLDRKALGRRVFSDPEALAALNRITHPRIRQRLEASLRNLAQRPPKLPVVIVEAAILIEAGWQTAVDRVIVVVVQPSTQVRRLTAGSGLPVQEAQARVNAQMPASERLHHADFRVSGETPLAETRDAVANILDQLCLIGGYTATLQASNNSAASSKS